MKNILFIIALLTVFTTRASIITALSDGQWSDGTTWDKGVPSCYDTIYIPVGINVTVSSTENYEGCTDMLILDEGTLTFVTGKKIKLPCGAYTGVIVSGSGLLVPGAGGGSSNYISICGNNVWTAAMGTISGYTLLPIELVSFDGRINDRGVDLTWVTKSELNNAEFIVEHSLNGIDWEELGSVNGAGESSIELNYEFVHDKPAANGNYYRLIQVDYDGLRTVYPPIYIVNGDVNYTAESLYAFPNPSNQTQRTIYYPRKGIDVINYSLYDMSGRQISSNSFPSTNNDFHVVDFSEVTIPGVYFLDIEGEVIRLIFL